MSQPTLQPKLSLFDAVCLIVGVAIGVGVYQFLPMIAQGTDGIGWLLGIWVLGGVVSLCGALAYAELGSAMPRNGGDYIYLTKAYGSWAGFLFGWMLTVVMRPADIAIMAFIFSRYFKAIWAPEASSGFAPYYEKLLAFAVVILLTAAHAVSVREGKWTHNILTIVKVLGILFIVTVAFVSPAAAEIIPLGVDGGDASPFTFATALLFVLFCFGGWNEVAYVAAEIKNPQRNILRSIIISIVLVMVVYLLITFAMLYGLGFEGIAQSEAVAADLIKPAFPVIGTRLIASLICVSALGAISGMIFAGARVTQALGSEHRLFRQVGKVHPRLETPLRALLLQCGIAGVMIFSFGSAAETLLTVSPLLYLFFIATSISVIILRIREPELVRPYRLLAFPLPILIFSGIIAWMTYGLIKYNPWPVLCLFGVLLFGLVPYLLDKHLSRATEEVDKS